MGQEPSEHQDLLQACARGDADALAALYEQEAPRMLALARAMLGSTSAAQDAVHDTLVLACKHAQAYDPAAGTVRAWLYSILRHRTRGLLQRSAPPAPRPDDAIEAITARLPGLLAGYRRPIAAAYCTGLPYDRLATQLGLSPTELRRLVRAGLLGLAPEHHPSATRSAAPRGRA